jgi:hypothetical protein
LLWGDKVGEYLGEIVAQWTIAGLGDFIFHWRGATKTEMISD